MLFLKVLGSPHIATDAGPLTGRAAQRHRLALLTLLAAARSRGLRRDKLTGLLWPESSDERARHYLSDSVYRLTQALGPDVIVAAGDELRLNHTRLPSDIETFQAALEASDLEAAVTAYGGPLLDGFFLPDTSEFDHWLEAERERLRRAYVHALEQLAERAGLAGYRHRALTAWRNVVTAEPLSTRAALQYMRALAGSGEPAAAIAHARVHAALLRDQLGLEPPAELQALEQEIRRQPLAAAPEPACAASHTPDAAESLPRLPQAALDPAAVTVSRPRAGTAKPLRWAMAALVAIAITALVVFVPKRAGSDNAARFSSIAVLPFIDLSENGSAYFADGMTEELIASLSHVPGLRVVSRTSVFALKQSALDVREVGRRLGVEAALEGSVRIQRGQLRVLVQLVNAGNGYEMWSDSFNRPIDDVLAVQQEIGRTVAEKLRGRLLAHEVAALQPRAVNMEAYDAYLQGRYHWHRRGPQDLVKATQFFESAVQRGPDYSRAWVGLADAYAIQGFYDYLPPGRAFPKARSAAEKALQLEPQLAAAQATLGYTALYFDWDGARAEELFRRTVELDPAYSTGHQWYANYLTAAGRFAEAEREMRRAQLFDPLSLIASAALGWSMVMARNYQQADQQLQRTLALDSAFQLAWLWRGWALEGLQRNQEMIASLRRGVEVSDSSAIQIAAYARALALTGKNTAAQELLARLRKGDFGYAPPYELAKIHLALGDGERALAELERAARERAHSLALINVDPQLDALRAAPRFRALQKLVKL